MDILLTHGYFLFEDEHEKHIMRPYPPLGILYISSHLKSQGYSVGLFDTTFSNLEAFSNHLAVSKPSIVGIYANMMTRRYVIEMIAICRSEGAKVVLGGPDPANYVENYIAHGADVVVIGEGERTLAELIPVLSTGELQRLDHIAGIAFENADGQIIRTEPQPYIDKLDEQPFPDRNAINIQQYMQTWKTHHGHSAVSLITARGCPYKCDWCSHAVFGYSHRRRSPENVVEEVAHIKANYDPDLLWYADDVFTINHRWLTRYAELLGQQNLHTPFETISREDRLNEDVIKTLAEMGCYRLWIGAESGSQPILDAMQRQTNVERVIEMVHTLQKYGIQAGMFIMLGYDGETQTDLRATVQTLKRASPDIFLTTVAYPIAGTGYYNKVKGRILSMQDWHLGSDSDYTVAGRHSKQFYRYATRWMVGEVGYSNQLKQTSPDYRKLARSFINANIGRLGMLLTQHQVERGQPE